MINLAGNQECDRYIREELTRAGIDIVEVPLDRANGEVPYTLEGRLPGYRFRRFWYYWVVDGRTPLDLAEHLYAHPEGRATVRVAGHCGCPPPAEWVKRDPDTGEQYVSNYHIDDQAGLLLFALVVQGKVKLEE